MTDKVQKIREEVERLKESGCASPIVICDTLLAFIDSLQEEHVSEDLEEDVSKYLNDIIGDYQRENCDTDADYLMSKEDMLEFARHFADWQNQQMIKNAITAHCFGFQNPDALFSFKQPAENYLVGSELKVVIIKED